MNWFEKFVTFISGEMTEPVMYGAWHIVSLLLVIGLTVFACIKWKDASQKTFKIFVLVCWISLVIFEIYKQVVFSFDTASGTWNYQWYAFPYQLCSTPMYVLPFVIFMKDGKVRDACMAYMSTVSLFGGLVTMFYPSTVFIETIGINIQTMLHHGLQVVLGIYFLVYNRKKLGIKYFLKGMIVFACTYAVAIILNFVIPTITSEHFNMFFVSKYYYDYTPVLSIFYPPTTPYPVFLIIYYLGVSAAGLIIFYIAYGIIKLCMRNAKKA